MELNNSRFLQRSLIQSSINQILDTNVKNDTSFKNIEVKLEVQFENKAKLQRAIFTSVELSQDISLYYNKLFSPLEVAESIKKRNEQLQIYQSKGKRTSQATQAFYKRRQTKVQKLQNKQQKELKSLYELQIQNPQKFCSIFQILKFLSGIKKQLQIDYYSSKTFLAIKGCTVKELEKLILVLKKIYSKSFDIFSNLANQINKYQQNNEQFRKQFLLLLRFLISRQKIQSLVREDQIQQNFIFMIGHLFLSPENNEANKKIPDNRLVFLLTQLLKQERARQTFKLICSINHGNKFRLKYGTVQYEKLYKMSPAQLRNLKNDFKGKNSKLSSSESQKPINLICQQSSSSKMKQISSKKIQIEKKRLQILQISKTNNEYQILTKHKKSKSFEEIQEQHNLL